MLTRNRPVVVVGNKYQTGNKYAPQNNKYQVSTEAPYTPSMSEQPTNVDRSTSSEVNTSNVMEERQKEQKQEMDKVDESDKVKTGYLHAIAGLNPQSEDTLYNVGYDEGIAVLAGTDDGFDWRPQGSTGIIAAATAHGNVYVARRGRGWQWWSDELGLNGRCASVAKAVAQAELSVRRVGKIIDLGPVLDEIVASNPGISPKAAVKIATKAARIASEASLR